MKPTTLKKQVLLGLGLLVLGAVNSPAVSLPSVGTLNVTILDENGALVSHAPVYIYGEQKTKFVGGKEISGTATLDMPAGTYRISCAIMRKTGEYYDRFASREAHVQVVAGDNTVLTLRLHALENPAGEVSENDISNMKIDGLRDGDQIARRF